MGRRHKLSLIMHDAEQQQQLAIAEVPSYVG